MDGHNDVPLWCLDYEILGGNALRVLAEVEAVAAASSAGARPVFAVWDRRR